MNKLKLIFIISMLFVLNLSANADNAFTQLQAKTSTNVATMDTAIKDNFIKAKYASAENRFIQSNVKASYDDFNELINKAEHDDYVFLLYGTW